MKCIVANPIYDSVFKFLMEDERIAKIILSALIKKEVVDVEMRRHEYPNITRDQISMFRVDFAANVKEPDGSIQLVLIELQKTWVDTETLRFRRYLAAQYNAEDNIQKEGKDAGYGIPMIAIYLLGHRIGDIDQAVVYVSHRAFDYEGQPVENGDDDPFINSLTHDSIVVQIPLLSDKIRNRLDKVLSVFNQSRRVENNQQLIDLDFQTYENDADMIQILHRLSLASMNADVRQEMNNEDEFYSVLESRETQLMKQNELINKQSAQISEQSAQISEQSAQISEQSAQISEQSAQINKQSAQISEQSAQISEQSAQISEQSAQISEQSAQISEQSAQIKALAEAMVEKGLSVDDIAKIIGRSVNDVENILNAN